MSTRVLVAGAGGFIGGHLVKRLLDDGCIALAVDIKPLKDWWQYDDRCDYGDNLAVGNADLRYFRSCMEHTSEVDVVYNLACDMGGIGFIERNKADCMVSVLINTNLLRAAVENKVQKHFYASSACVYHADRQSGNTICSVALAEADAYFEGGAMPEDGYGWEKLFSERMCRHFNEDYGVDIRVARFHNIYGPHGSWNDGREKAPAAICRKVAQAKRNGHLRIDIWGNGSQTRSFCYIDDCIEGIQRLMESNYQEPMNIGSSELVTIDDLVDITERTAEYPVEVNCDMTKPQGVVGRNSDNTLCQQVLGWEPKTSLASGIAKTYPWIEKEVERCAHKES
jgi:nucleoside-diphosphate-sugar epimerase